ncbi:uncharacterized protein LOC124880300 isoform X1 [Girardinichthys multiradiatus]|uniref:uncharacterized protein LOC124880300 isoform X1 n=1 Tax=Girardinichthys multiradiatus TaxID=208333 RepID=UPI001FACCF8D|nr:uncharacterized protein LOC124880300 isoform X1 [Girardinichthys multiradiatus]
MTSPTFTLYLPALLVMIVAHRAAWTHRLLLMESAEVGHNTALQCLCQDDLAVMFYWYKQILGKEPKLVCTLYKHNNIAIFQDQFNNSRFSLDNENHSNILLKIADLRVSDSATYYCVKSNLAEFTFCEGTTLSVNGFGMNLRTLLHQSKIEPIQSRSYVSLNCTVQTGSCGGEHSYYWISNSVKSHPGLIYGQGGLDQCERKSNTDPTRHRCTFNLPMNSLAETYFCAVASCGHLLFGNRTILHSEADAVSIVLVYVLGGVLTFTTILVASLAFSVYRLSKICNQQTECSGTFSARHILTTQLHQDGENLQYAAINNLKPSMSGRTKESFSECVYSTVRQ